MQRLKSIAISSLLTVLVLALLEAVIPQASGITVGSLKLLWNLFRGLFASDFVLSVGLFVVFALAAFGTVRLSRSKENKLWAIVSAVVSVVSFLGLLMKSKR